MDDILKIKAENEELKNINLVRSDLISISAHQLRTSLSASKWILKMFLDKDLGDITSEQENLLNKAYESTERMIMLTNEMITLNHTEDKILSFNFQDVDLVELLEQTIFEFYGESHKKEIELIFLKPSSILNKVSVDKEMIRVVFQNLVENSIKYSNIHGKVVISISQNEDEIDLSVRDTGITISNDDQKHIFEKFYRTENAKQKDAIGSGLGLYTTKKIVENHKGKIWFESDEKGTTFFITLPLNN
ncbi:MAG: HAMP domain-containing sensor histidine kinase [Candidatus Nomurabacteria bacterium]|nr:HAMP domain-containing sensor histidine kinase [Candidatus Nomurabacteria bacterium]